jgi:lactoylglutathione lyase
MHAFILEHDRPMTLNHLNLTVTDVPAARQFLETYFGLQGHTNPYTGEMSAVTGSAGFAVLFDDAGLVLTLMKGRADLTYPPTFHIGFMRASEQAVNEMHERLRRDGYEADEPSRSHAWTFYVRAPGGFTVEVLC